MNTLSCAARPGSGLAARAEALPLAASATPPTALAPVVGGAKTTRTRWSAGCRIHRSCGLCPSSAGGAALWGVGSSTTARSCLRVGWHSTTGPTPLELDLFTEVAAP